jgi:hypothetical protein
VTWTDVLVLLMLALPPHHLDEESPEARRARLSVVGQAIDEASARATCRDAADDPSCVRQWPGNEQDLGILLVTQAYWESRLALNVHEGRCRSYECDPFINPRTGRLEHRSRSLWQLQRSSLIEEEWTGLEGVSLEATRNAAYAAAKLLGRGLRACHTVQGAISRYAGVGRCTWSGAAARHRQFLELRARAARLRASEDPVDPAAPPPRGESTARAR